MTNIPIALGPARFAVLASLLTFVSLPEKTWGQPANPAGEPPTSLEVEDPNEAKYDPDVARLQPPTEAELARLEAMSFRARPPQSTPQVPKSLPPERSLAGAFQRLLDESNAPWWGRDGAKRQASIDAFVNAYAAAVVQFDGSERSIPSTLLLRLLFTERAQPPGSHPVRLLNATDRSDVLSGCARHDPLLRTLLISEMIRLALVDRELSSPEIAIARTRQDLRPLAARSLSLTDRLGAESAESSLLSVPRTQPRLVGLWFRELATALLASHVNELLSSAPTSRIAAANQLYDACSFVLACAEMSGLRGAIAAEVLDSESPIVAQSLLGEQDSQRGPLLTAVQQATRNIQFEHDISEIRQRLSSLEARVTALEDWAKRVDARLASLEDAVVDLKGRVVALEKWKSTVEERLSNIELRLELMELFGLPPGAPGRPYRSSDGDRDLIDDVVEGMLIDAYSPVYRLYPDSRPAVSAEWFVRHSRLEIWDSEVRTAAERHGVPIPSRGMWTADPTRFLAAYEECVRQIGAAELALSLSKIRQGFSLRLDSESFRSGGSDLGEPVNWAPLLETGGSRGVYAHVVRGEATNEYIVQFFMLLAWNETAYTFGYGNHEGDWLCAMILVSLPEYKSGATPPSIDRNPREYSADEWSALSRQIRVGANGSSGEAIDATIARGEIEAIRAALEDPLRRKSAVVAMRVCNHGRYIDVRVDHVEWVEGGNAGGTPVAKGPKPVLWMEGGANELWPNGGGRGFGGWPAGQVNGRNVDMFEAGLFGGGGEDHEKGPQPPWRGVGVQYYRDGRDHKEIDSWPIQHDAFTTFPWEFVRLIDGEQRTHYRVSFDFGRGEDGTAINEHKVVRGHRGSRSYRTFGVPNIGEWDSPQTGAASFVLGYHGRWGGWGKRNESPPGPWKEEMWIDVDPRLPTEWYTSKGRPGRRASEFPNPIRPDGAPSAVRR